MEELDRNIPDAAPQVSAYGQVIPIVYGRARVQGNVIWQLDTEEVKTEALTGTNKNVEYTYYSTFAASFGDSEVEAIEKIWLDGKLIYDGILAENKTLLTNGNFETWTDSTTPGTWSTSGTIACNDTYLDPDVVGSVYSAKLSTGTSATSAYVQQSVTFASTNQHNFRMRVYCVQPNGQWCRLVVSFDSVNHTPWFQVPTNRWTTISGSYTPSSAAAEDFRITIRDVASADVYLDSVTLIETQANALDGDDANFAMEVHLGAEDQAVSEIISANHPYGSAYAPAFRGQPYVVFCGLPLKSFNNRLPKIEAQTQAQERGVNDIIENVCDRCGLEPYEYDVSEMDDTFSGMVITSERTGVDILSPVKDASPFAVREDDSKIFFQKMSAQSSVASFTEDDLNARDDGNEPDTSLRIKIEDIGLLPIEVTVTAKDPDHEQDDSTQRAKCYQLTIGTSKSYNWPIIADADQIRQFADVLLARAWLEARGFEFEFGSDNLYLQPGDIVTITRGTEDITIRITDIEFSGLGQLTCSGVEYSADCFESDSLGAGSDVGTSAPATN